MPNCKAGNTHDMRNLNQYSDADIIQRLANAMVTGANCGGHTKAHYNYVAVDEYRAELESRKVSIPSNKELYAQGAFNGVGSW